MMKKINGLKSIVSALVLLSSLNGMAQLTDWESLHAIEVTETSGITKTDFQVSFTIATDTSINVGNMQADGSDIRFASDCEGINLLDFWIEDYLNTDSTLFWVKIPSLTASEVKEVFMLYNNANTVPIASNFDATFPSQRLVTTDATLTLIDSIWSEDWIHIESGVTVTLPDNHPGLTLNSRKIIIEGNIDANGAGYVGGASNKDG
jgi:hypothetical protein